MNVIDPSRTRDERIQVTQQMKLKGIIIYIYIYLQFLYEILCFFAPLISPSSDVVGMTEGVEALVLHPESSTIPCSRRSCSSHFPPSAPSNSQTWLNNILIQKLPIRIAKIPTFCRFSEEVAAPSLSPGGGPQKVAFASSCLGVASRQLPAWPLW